MTDQLSVDLIVAAIAEGFDKLNQQVNASGNAVEKTNEKIDDSSKKAKKSIGDLGKGLNNTVQELTGFNIAQLGAAGALALVAKFVGSSVREAEDAAKAQAQLEAVIKSTGSAAGMTAGDINEMADVLRNLTGVDNDLIAEQSAVMLTFTNIGQDVFPDAMQAALDLSAALDQGLQTSVVQLGKALNDPVEGVSALSRVGVSFTEDQKEMIKTLMGSGKVIEAQRVVLAELQKEFGGTAKAMHDVSSGSEDLNNAIADLKEQFGKGLLPTVRNTNRGLASMVDAVTVSMDAQTSLREAARLGIITQEELAAQLDKIAFTSYTAADAVLWLKFQIEEFNSAQEMGADFMNAGQSALDGYTEAAKGTADATKEVTKANKEAQKSTRDWMAELDTGLENTISNWLDELKFMAAGGGEVQAAALGVKAALLANTITPDEAKQYFNELYVQAELVKVEMGEITANEAAQNIRNTLGVSLQEALDLVKQVKSAAQFNVTSWITVKVKMSGNPLGVSGGILAGGKPGGQYGLSKTVPPGYPNDSFPVFASSGEKVLIIPNRTVAGLTPPDLMHTLPQAGGGGFTPAMSGGSAGSDSGVAILDNSTTINQFHNYSRAAAAISTAMAMNSRLRRLNDRMG